MDMKHILDRDHFFSKCPINCLFGALLYDYVHMAKT